jgi:MFS family permease
MWFLLALYMQEVLRWSPTETGAAFLPLALLISVGASQGGPLARRFGARTTIIGSFAAAAGGFWLLTTLDAHGSFLADILAPSIILGLGLGASLVPLTLACVHGAPAGDTGIASGLVNVSRQVGGALGVAVLGTIAASRTAELLPTRAAGDALTAGYQRAFWVAGAFAVVGAAIALFLPAERPAKDMPALAIEPAAT